jgi:hypothetical protein
MNATILRIAEKNNKAYKANNKRFLKCIKRIFIEFFCNKIGNWFYKLIKAKPNA